MVFTPITIILPVCNGAKHLRETIDSLLRQTYARFELLVIDDGSRDSSGDIVRSVKDDRIRLISQENRGLSHALNRGIQEARTPYVARNDQDDLSLPERLERQLRIMRERPDTICLFSNHTKFGVKRSWSNADKQATVPGSVKEYEPLRDGCLLGSTMFARTEALRVIGGFRQEYYPSDDWDLELRVAQVGKVLLLREPLVSYRFHTSANTYRLFALMQEKVRWAEDSYRRRNQGAPELSFEQFLAAQPTRWAARLEQRRVDASRLQMRTAGQRYLDGRDIEAFLHMAAAVMLNPNDLIGRISFLVRRAT